MRRVVHGRSIFFFNGDRCVEFDPTWTNCLRPTVWFKKGGTVHATIDGVQITFPALEPDASYNPDFEAPRTHRLYAAFKAVVEEGLPVEPFLDMLIEDFPRYEPHVSRIVEGR